MEVILLERIKNLGHVGDKVNVKPGFARNFLVPYQKAVPATKQHLADFEASRVELEKRAKELLAEAEKRAAALNAISLTLARKASDEGKLYGAVSIHDLIEAIKEKGQDVEKRELTLLEDAIRSVGVYHLEVNLHSDVVANIEVTVDAS